MNRNYLQFFQRRLLFDAHPDHLTQPPGGGLAKLKIAEMGSRYLFVCLDAWLKKTLIRGDYRKPTAATPQATQAP